MTAMIIIAMIFAMLSTGLLMAIYILRLRRKMHSQEVLALVALGLLFLGHLFLMIGWAADSASMGVLGSILYLLGWPALAGAFAWMHPDLFAGLAAKVEAAQASQQGPDASQQPQQPQSDQAHHGGQAQQ
jgi:hypothetical protein